MKPFIFTSEAISDVTDIWQYLAEEASEAIADLVIARIYDACLKLSEMPGIGHYRENLLDRRHRFWSSDSYIIAYRWQTRPLQIIAVIHGARNLDAFFSTPPSP